MKALVGVSGGVDSTFAVLEAQRQGFLPVACILVMQRSGAHVPPQAALERARESMTALSVELIEEEVTEAFAERVVEPFLDAYEAGYTPNPCVACNRELKVASLLAVADRLAIPNVMTGHYARTVQGKDGVVRVARAVDPLKDQSYFLGRLAPKQVERLLFPTGELTKAQVREVMRQKGLAVAEDKDSLGVCFAPNGDYRALLRERRPRAFVPGPIVDEDGNVLGTHEGVGTLTVGQRKGLRLSGGPWFVQSIDVSRQTIVVGKDKRPLIRSLELSQVRFNTEDDELIAGGLKAQTHYRSADHPVLVERLANDRAQVRFLDAPVLAAPGQSVVFYADDVVMGEGTITAIKLE